MKGGKQVHSNSSLWLRQRQTSLRKWHPIFQYRFLASWRREIQTPSSRNPIFRQRTVLHLKLTQENQKKKNSGRFVITRTIILPPPPCCKVPPSHGQHTLIDLLKLLKSWLHQSSALATISNHNLIFWSFWPEGWLSLPLIYYWACPVLHCS